MTRASRLVALLALLAVGWATLWPLVAAAHAASGSQPMPLCHGAGGMVPMDEAPQSPAVPGQPVKQHCPLCIMAFYCGFSQPPSAPGFSRCTRIVVYDVHCARPAYGVEVVLPFGRAPPRSSPA